MTDEKILYGEAAKEETKKRGKPIFCINVYQEGEEVGLYVEKNDDAADEKLLINGLINLCASYGMICVPARSICVITSIIDRIENKLTSNDEEKGDETSENTEGETT